MWYLSNFRTFSKRCAKGGKTGAQFSVEEGFVQRGRCEVQQRQTDYLVRQLLIDASEILMALVARSVADRYGVDTGYLAMFYVLRQPVLLSFFDDLANDDVEGVRQGAVLDKKFEAADGRKHEIKTEGAYQQTTPVAIGKWSGLGILVEIREM